jgi:hypothetical protein
MVIGGIVRPGRITELADIIGKNTGNKTGGGVGHETHGVADPITPVKCFLGSGILIDIYTNRYKNYLYRCESAGRYNVNAEMVGDGEKII